MTDQRDKLAQTKNEFNDYEQLHQDFVQKRAALNRQKRSGCFTKTRTRFA